MTLTRTSFLRLTKIIGAIIIIALIASYAIWRSSNYARGPHIILVEPSNFASIDATTTHVIGRVERAHIITLNGRTITIDENGNFDETIVLFPGTNVLTLEAKDQFERNIQQQIRVFRP